MQFLLQLDVGLFRFINQSLSNPAFDWLMPLASGTPYFVQTVLSIAAALLIWGGPRGRVFVILFALAILVTDGFLCNNLKHLIGRPRPFLALEGVITLAGKSGSGSMPSAHSANWAAATMMAFLIYRRRCLWFMVPLTLLISFSRIYNGVHYPSDVLVGWLVGAGGAAFAAVVAQSLWNLLGRKLLPRQHARFPSLLAPGQPSISPPA